MQLPKESLFSRILSPGRQSDPRRPVGILLDRRAGQRGDPLRPPPLHRRRRGSHRPGRDHPARGWAPVRLTLSGCRFLAVGPFLPPRLTSGGRPAEDRSIGRDSNSQRQHKTQNQRSVPRGESVVDESFNCSHQQKKSKQHRLTTLQSNDQAHWKLFPPPHNNNNINNWKLFLFLQ